MQRLSVRLYPSTHIRTAEVAISEVRRLCLPAIAYISPAQNASVSPTIERWLDPRQIARKPRGRTWYMSSCQQRRTVPRTLSYSPQSSDSSFQYAVARIELLLTSHDLLACLHVIAYVSLSTCPSFLTSGVSYSVHRMLNRCFGGSNLQSTTAA
jgi:hypothetical protein